MKKRLFAMFLMLTALGGASCQDDTTESDPAVVLNPPTLTATPDEVVITGSETSSVLELEWSPAAQTENVTYTLIYGLSGETTTHALKCGTDLIKRFSRQEIDALRTELGVETDAFGLDFCVEANHSAVPQAVTSPTVNVAIRYDIPEVVLPLELYPIGDSFAWGWKRDKAEKMSTEDHVTFTWTGDLSAGAFKFLTHESIANKSWLPSYNRNETAEEYWTMVLRSDESTPDTQFKIDEAGNYTITLNVETLAVKVIRNDEPEEPEVVTEEQLYVYGLSGSDRVPMTSADKTLWSWTGEAKAGKFKFFCVDTGWFPSYNYDRTENGVIYAYKREQGNARDDLFEITEAGNYTFSIGVNTLVVTISRNEAPELTTEEQLYVYGLSGSDRIPMTSADKTTWSWTGNTAAGRFKFFCVDTGWFPSYNYDRTENGVIYAYKREQGDARDDLFEITEEGNYTFTINVHTLVVTIVRNGDRTDQEPPAPSYEYDGLWLYGTANPNGSKLANMIRLETQDNLIFTYEGNLNGGGNGISFKFMCYADKWWPAFVRDGEETSMKMLYSNGEWTRPSMSSKAVTTA